MDSFSVFFRDKPSDDQIRAVVVATGALASVRAPGEIVVTQQDAHLWIDSYLSSDLPSRTFWPIPKDDVGRIIMILVSSDAESSSLAVEIAHRLAVDLGGIISWDDHTYWKTLYEKAYQPKSSA
jgi:hypothetical protein